ncbi:hypothetical protein CDL12_23847 [Handroanthus impetiginosus]|uniref:WRC domain-containing protein n=1 Tax=Handroanthus impetiginosus TaxID=429701 RepID=A0A2G9GE96_9LAMI|nr:hypothetical protein CDL12_23847 [Handroanthus impetiginosus]
MRIRKRLAPSSIPAVSLSDLQLQRSEAAPPPSDQPSAASKQPSDQSMVIPSKNNRWVFAENDKMKQKEFGDDETWRLEETKSTNNDIRKIVSICDGDDYKLVPLKKRKWSFDRNPSEETLMGTVEMKSKTNKKCGIADAMQVDRIKPVIEENGIDHSSNGNKKKKRGNVIMEGSRCSRINGRGWRCCQPTLVGYSLCEHHLGKGRLRSMTSVRRGGGGGGGATEEKELKQPLMVIKKRTKVGVVKARSMSSLLSQI